jgi:hypothetical protein
VERHSFGKVKTCIFDAKGHSNSNPLKTFDQDFVVLLQVLVSWLECVPDCIDLHLSEIVHLHHHPTEDMMSVGLMLERIGMALHQFVQTNNLQLYSYRRLLAFAPPLGLHSPAKHSSDAPKQKACGSQKCHAHHFGSPYGLGDAT